MGQYVFKLPDVGEGTAEAEIVAWHVRVGETIAEDAPLVDVMTDKATVEMTSPVSGKVIALNGEPGEMAAVGSAIAVLETASVEAPEGKPAPNGAHDAPPEAKPRVKVPAGGMLSPEAYAAAEAELERKKAPSQSLARPLAREPAAKEKRSALASPPVRQRAEQLGVDLASVDGSGPAGRVTHQDLDRVLMSGQPRRAGGALAERHGIEPVKVIGLRRKIAEKMAEANRRIPHITYVEECDVISPSSRCCRS
jgi:2-oxoisovalerate dehydrogenase E2 component (dihydrolipoyl transacylase)